METKLITSLWVSVSTMVEINIEQKKKNKKYVHKTMSTSTTIQQPNQQRTNQKLLNKNKRKKKLNLQQKKNIYSSKRYYAVSTTYKIHIKFNSILVLLLAVFIFYFVCLVCTQAGKATRMVKCYAICFYTYGMIFSSFICD